LSHARQEAKTYQFYQFLIDACEVGLNRSLDDEFWNDPSRKDLLYFGTDPVNTPWYRVAGIEADHPQAPFAWLQNGIS
jgi:hypothetical protein